MALTAAQSATLANLQALKAAAGVADLQALIAWLNSATGAQAGVALCNAAIADLDVGSTALARVNELLNLLNLSANNLTTAMSPLQTLAATVAATTAAAAAASASAS